MLDVYQIGLKIKKLREEKNLSQEDLAEQLFLTRQAISKWETGNAFPNIDMVITLSQYFLTSIDDILCLNENPKFDHENIFSSHSRDFVIDSIINGKLKVDIIQVMKELTQLERVRIIVSINDGLIKCDEKLLRKHLLISEQKLLKRRNEK
jgi:transcriptional regulator with XRE-family HTH domain